MFTTWHLSRHSRRFFSEMPASLIRCSQQFILSNNQKGLVIKIQLTPLQESLKQVKQVFHELLKGDNLHLLTMPTQRLNGDFPDTVYPGHNASFITNSSSEIIMSLSKRQGKKYLGFRKRIPDDRFPTSTTVGVFSSRFTTIEEEIEIWYKRAIMVNTYPLYLHILPLHEQFTLSEQSYRKNAQAVIDKDEPYTLFSSISDKFAHQSLPASNCNTATEMALFGPKCITSSHDKFCQQAIFEMVLRLAKDSTDYPQKMRLIKLTEGSEEPKIDPDVYLSMASM